MCMCMCSDIYIYIYVCMYKEFCVGGSKVKTVRVMAMYGRDVQLTSIAY